MSLKKNFKLLLTRLSEDATLRSAIEQIRAQAAGPGKNGEGKFEALPGGLMQIILLAGRFVGKKRARTFGDIIDIIAFLISLSLIIKQNIFDRPEVQEFLRKTWKDVSNTTIHLVQLVRDYVERRLKRSY